MISSSALNNFTSIDLDKSAILDLKEEQKVQLDRSGKLRGKSSLKEAIRVALEQRVSKNGAGKAAMSSGQSLFSMGSDQLDKVHDRKNQSPFMRC